MIFRKATVADVAAAVEIYNLAREYMKKTGNPDQWAGEYPSAKDVLEGIAAGESFVVEDGGEIIATLQFRIGREPCYNDIYEGAWISDAPYAVIHRIAVKHHGKGIADFCFEECFHRHENLKIDTHRDNTPMQKKLTKMGFEYCGVIYLQDGSERLAYQKVGKRS